MTRPVVRGVVRALTALCLAASPAVADVAEVTTSVPLRDAQDEAAVRDAVQKAVDVLRTDARGFTPTVVVLTSATIVGDRLYMRLLVADQDGERAFEEERSAPEPAAESLEQTL